MYSEGILPFKHYSADVIRTVIENGSLSSDCIAENSTQYRWLREFLDPGTLMSLQRAVLETVPNITSEPEPGDRYPLLSSYQKLHRHTWFTRFCVFLRRNFLSHRFCVGLSPPPG